MRWTLHFEDYSQHFPHLFSQFYLHKQLYESYTVLFTNNYPIIKPCSLINLTLCGTLIVEIAQMLHPFCKNAL